MQILTGTALLLTFGIFVFAVYGCLVLVVWSRTRNCIVSIAIVLIYTADN